MSYVCSVYFLGPRGPRFTAKERPTALQKNYDSFIISLFIVSLHHKCNGTRLSSPERDRRSCLRENENANSTRKLNNITFHKSSTLLDFVN